MVDEIIRSYARTLDYLRRLVDDIPDEFMARQTGGAVNHPAWILGHLIHSAQAIGGEIGLPPWLPSNWHRQFGTGSTPASDRSQYPKKATLLAALTDGQKRITERLNELGDQGLSGPLPDVRYREEFPTLGHAVLHILTSHAAIHVGQLTVWRRAVGLGPLQDVFI